MKKLYVDALQRVLTEIEMVSHKRSEIDATLLRKYGRDVTYKNVCRLPDKEVKAMLKIPCPIKDITIERDKLQHEIKVFKKLRQAYQIDEENHCSKCPNYNVCPFSNIPYQSMENVDKREATAMHDFLFFFLSIEKLKKDSISELRWCSAYKVASVLITLFKDIDYLRKESLLFQKVFQGEQTKLYKQLNHRIIRRSKKEELKTKLEQRTIILPERRKRMVE